MPIKPLADRVVATKQTAQPKTASGLYLGEAKEKPAYATIESIGPDVKTVKKGDRILYKEYTATEIKLENQEYLILKEEDILATL